MSRLDATYELVRIASHSREEGELAAHVETVLREFDHLDVERIGDNVVARTNEGHARRVIVAGHLDTVPGDPTAARIEGTTLIGLGSCDMKGSLAVMLEVAARPARSRDVTWIFYAREEISRRESGLMEVAQRRPELLVADAALLAEPTGGVVELGCQGSMRIEIVLRGRRAHSARPFTGVNAIHRAGPLIERIAGYHPREITVEGVVFVEQLQVVGVEGGIAANVVPDEVRLLVNHRIAPDRDLVSAQDALRNFLGDLLIAGDSLVILDFAAPAPPLVANTEVQRLIELTKATPRAKVGWTDVATFFELGVPATNFGAGDPLLAHRSDESVSESELDEFARVLVEWLN